MQATVFSEVGKAPSVEEVDPIEPGRNDVVVRIAASGVCASDHHVLLGSLPFPTPLILGHEAAGTVEAVGSGVTRVSPGDRVIASPDPCCAVCWYCAQGQPTLCEALPRISTTPRVRRADGSIAFGMVGLGTFAEFMTVDEASVVPVETDLPFEQLALIGCGVTTGVGAVLVRARVQAGSSVVVVGCGGVGLSVIQGARIAGAETIVAIDPVEARRKAALGMGATAGFDPGEGDAADRVRSLTDGRGADYVFEAVGRPETCVQSIDLARPGGTFVLVGAPAPGDRLDISLWEFFGDAKTVMTTRFGSVDIRRDIPRFVKLAESGLLDLASLVTRTAPLETGEVNAAFTALERGEAVRTVLVPRSPDASDRESGS